MQMSLNWHLHQSILGCAPAPFRLSFRSCAPVCGSAGNPDLHSGLRSRWQCSSSAALQLRSSCAPAALQLRSSCAPAALQFSGCAPGCAPADIPKLHSIQRFCSRTGSVSGVLTDLISGSRSGRHSGGRRCALTRPLRSARSNALTYTVFKNH